MTDSATTATAPPSRAWQRPVAGRQPAFRPDPAADQADRGAAGAGDRRAGVHQRRRDLRVPQLPARPDRPGADQPVRNRQRHTSAVAGRSRDGPAPGHHGRTVHRGICADRRAAEGKPVRSGQSAAGHPVQRRVAQGQLGAAGDGACAGRRQRLAGTDRGRAVPRPDPGERRHWHAGRRREPGQHQPDHREAGQHRPDRRRDRRARPGHRRRRRGPHQPAAAGRDRADGRRDRRRGF